MTYAKNVNLRIERSDGKVFRIGTGTDWSIPSDGLENWAKLPYSVSTSANVLQDGSTLTGKRVEQQDRSVSAEYTGPTEKRADARAQAIAFFNPRFTFKAHLTYMGRERYAEGEQYAFTVSDFNVYQNPELAWTVLCLNPYLNDEDGNERDFTDAVPMIGWPYVSHVREQLPNGEKYPVGHISSKLIFDDKNTVYNNGDVSTKYTVHMEFTGTITNPVFYQGERYVKILDTFVQGDVMEIDFRAAPPRVTKNGENIITRATRDSKFTGMEMTVGKNTFRYDCENHEDRTFMHVSVRFRKQYLGV